MAKIFMPLLDEGTDVWRPVEASHLGGELYRVEGPVPEDEIWAFPPGVVVVCVIRTFSGGERALAASEGAPT
jgi:hypothetical protein